jgi:hypothetical protein
MFNAQAEIYKTRILPAALYRSLAMSDGIRLKATDKRVLRKYQETGENYMKKTFVVYTHKMLFG